METQHLHEMTQGYITAALWADAMPLCTCEGDPRRHHECESQESGGLEHLDVRPEDYAYVFALCKAFADAAGAELAVYAELRAFQPAEGTVWHYIGHDLRLTSGGHGTGFWDREPEPTNMVEGDAERFATARAWLTTLSRHRRFDRSGGGDVWQQTDDIVAFDHYSLDSEAGPGDRWRAPAFTPAQLNAWVETGILPTIEETFPVEGLA